MPHHTHSRPKSILDQMDIQQLEPEDLDAIEDPMQGGSVTADNPQPRHAVPDGDVDILELRAQQVTHRTLDRDLEDPPTHTHLAHLEPKSSPKERREHISTSAHRLVLERVTVHAVVA
jgi:hypothetical protein